jgi:diguanylate cyclase (GGDEF)-like protein
VAGQPSADDEHRPIGLGLIRARHDEIRLAQRLNGCAVVAAGFDEARRGPIAAAVEACGGRLVGFGATGGTDSGLPGPEVAVGAFVVGPDPTASAVAVAASRGWETIPASEFGAICQAVLTRGTRPATAMAAQLERARAEARRKARAERSTAPAATEEDVMAAVQRRLHVRGAEGAERSRPVRKREASAPTARPARPEPLPDVAAPSSPARVPEVEADRRGLGAVIRGALGGEWKALRDEVLELRELVAANALAARTDPLTGIANRRRFEEDLPAAHEEAMLAGRGYAVIFLDLDHFGELNKLHGHEAGDAALRGAALAFEAALGGDGCLYRIGGEEFVAILPGVSASEGLAIGERLRAGLRERGVRRGPASDAGLVTASVGVAAHAAEITDANEVLRSANLAMLGAKVAGRDRVAVADAA